MEKCHEMSAGSLAAVKLVASVVNVERIMWLLNELIIYSTYSLQFVITHYLSSSKKVWWRSVDYRWWCRLVGRYACNS